MSETMKKLSILFAVFVYLCIAQATVYGQGEENKRAKMAQVPEGKITIFNSSYSIQAHFALLNDTGFWKSFSLDPRKHQMFTTAISLRIATKNGRTKRYKLEDQTRYIIFWDRQNGWALAKAAQQD